MEDKDLLPYMVDTMAADDLAKQGRPSFPEIFLFQHQKV